MTTPGNYLGAALDHVNSGGTRAEGGSYRREGGRGNKILGRVVEVKRCGGVGHINRKGGG